MSGIMIPLALETVTWVVLIVLLVVLVAIVLLIRKKGKQEAAAVEKESLAVVEATIRDARVNDIVSVVGFSADFDDVDFTIEKRNRYESHGFEWYELLGVHQGKQVWIEWEEDDALEISATSPERKIRLSALNLTEDDLARVDEEESTDNHIVWEGRNYFYQESCEALFFKDCGGPGEGFYLWDFATEDHEDLISIEKWEGEPFQVFSGKAIKPHNVKVYKR